MTTTKSKGLHAKLAEVMVGAERIPKNGTAPPQMGGFKFVQSGDAADHIRKALGERGVSMLPTAVEFVERRDYETKSGAVMTEITVRQTWTLTDGETGETATIQSIGSGADTGDKAAPKAMTSAMKYAHLTGFMLSTGDDVEQHDTSDRQTRPEGESVDLIGVDTVSGIVKKGGSDRYQSEWRDTPQGHVIGFALKRNGEAKDLPQVGLMGPIAETLYASGDFPTGAELVGQRVTLHGRFYSVRQLGRTTYQRLIVGQSDKDFIETDELRIPPLPSEAIAPGQESFALTDEEKAVIATGTPE
jgi:hypothetical protein